MIDDTVAIGRRNKEVIELARRHCLNLEFTEWAGTGRGMVEATMGLPIGSRRVRCPYESKPGGISGNLEWIASDFYVDNCVGCPYRRPTGEVPNLGTLVEAQRREKDQAAEADRLALQQRREAWSARAEVRPSLRANADPGMVGAVDDIAVIDGDPAVDSAAVDKPAALRRLSVFAAQAPQTFTESVVDHALDVVAAEGVTSLLGPLRELATHRPEFRAKTVRTALTQLRRGADVEAARCIVDFDGLPAPSDYDHDVVRSLVALAGRPELTVLGRRAARSPEPAGLRVAANVAGDVVIEVISGLLRPDTSETTLLVPAGGRSGLPREGSTDLERSTAAGAIRALAATHPEVVRRLSAPLVRSLRDEEEDLYGLHPVADLQRAIAMLIVRGILTTEPLHEAAAHASDEYRERLFEVLSRVRWIADPDDRFPEAGDPAVDDDARSRLHGLLVEECLARLSGDWGVEVAFHAADLLEDLAGDDPASMSSRVPALLGAVLALVEGLGRRPFPRIDVVDDTSPQLAAMDEFSRKQSLHAAAQRVLKAIELASRADVKTALAAVLPVMQEERDRDREIELRWRLLPLIGRIGRRQGDDNAVLRLVLPVLHAYLVDADPALRGAALDAWVEVGSRHDLPSSLRDLLPGLLQDPYKVVIKALLVAARRLDWEPTDDNLLLRHALNVADWAAENVSKDKDILKEALFTIRRLGRSEEAGVRAAVDLLVLNHASALHRYDLRDVLRGEWAQIAVRSAQMASHRLRLARDPYINDRFNARDYDEELTALLECGVGLVDLPIADLTAAALDFARDYPFASAEFMEVAWRAGRLADAEGLMASVADSIPDQPAFLRQRAIAHCFKAAAATDVVVANRDDNVQQSIESAWDALRRLAEFQEEEEQQQDGCLGGLVRQVSIRVAARAVLLGLDTEALDELEAPPVEGMVEPAAARRARADRLEHVARLLADGAKELTATGKYLRAYADAMLAAAHLVRFDAAEFDGDHPACESHLTAAARRARDSMELLAGTLGCDDPLAGPLTRTLDDFGDVRAGQDVDAILRRMAALPLPLLVIRGPRGRRRRRSQLESPSTQQPASPMPVGVVLAYIDDHVVTGPQVLRPKTVHRLKLEVSVDEWPEWATALDAEFVSHLTVEEAEMPTFTWARPVSEETVFEGTGTLILRFGLPAGQPAPPFLLKLRFRGQRDRESASEQCDVTGHRELRLRPFDASRDALTQYPVVDERLLRLYEQLHGAGYDEEQVQAFCRLLTAVCRVGFTMTWEKRYKKGARVRERDFHDDLFDRLKADPDLGGRMERGSPSALGYLDVRHDGITAELKVERTVPVTRDSAPKYLGQPTQYAAADGARLSILCVLDMSPKQSPVGTPENYIFQLQPGLHGLTNPEAPSIVTVVIVNGNLPTPSSWSRRKLDAKPVERRTDE